MKKKTGRPSDKESRTSHAVWESFRKKKKKLPEQRSHRNSSEGVFKGGGHSGGLQELILSKEEQAWRITMPIGGGFWWWVWKVVGGPSVLLKSL